MLTPLWWMAGPSVASWLVLATLTEADTARALLFGMIGPLMVAVGSWLLTASTHRRNPEAVTSVMMAAFAGKLVIVGGYVAVMLWGLSLRPVPFVASFAGYFVVLYGIEALYLRRLFAGGTLTRSE